MSRRVLAWVTLFAVLFFARASRAAPSAHILRIDPRAGMTDGQPVLTTVLELVQFNPMSEVVTNKGCGQLKGDALLDCISSAVETKNALWQAFPFPEQNARLFIRVDGSESPAKFVSKASWAASSKDPLAGTAWLIALDASSMMGPRYADAREVANQFLGSLGPNDIAKLIIFDDRVNAYTAVSQWVPAAQKAQLVAILAANASPSPSHGRGRPFSNQIKGITKAFGDMGNSGAIQHVPMHQAMVVLSNGAGREDVNSPAAAAEVMKQYFDKGRFPEDNPLSPKTPLPVISIYFPAAHGGVNDLYASNDMQFMQDLANPEIGGFFDIVRQGQGLEKSKTILSLVKQRFNLMWVVKWRLACLASTPEQTFNLVFPGVTSPAIIPDGTFKDVPIGVDPTTWPLDINVAQTKAEAEANPIHPGGTFRVFGDFCWGGDKQRAEAYFVPAGTKPDPNVNRSDPDLAKKAMQSLIAQNMHGTAIEAGDTFVTLNVPDEEKILEGQGENTVTRLVVYDNKAHRASGYDEKTVLTLRASKKPFNLPIILGAAGLVVVILLLVVVLMRGGGGGGGKKRTNQPPPTPVVAGGAPPYGGGAPPAGGAPPYGGGYPPGGGYGGGGGGGGGGYGASPPDPRGGGYPLAGGAPGIVQVRCPSCKLLTMATPGQTSVCFSCGQPLPKDLASAAPGPAEAGAFPLTGGMPSALEPPPNPYAAPTGATILGAAGQFAIRVGVEIKVGRDPAECPIALSEPRVSGVHATLKFDGGRLMVKDEGSNNGTYVDGARIAASTWTPVPGGAALRFGPVEFSVRLG